MNEARQLQKIQDDAVDQFLIPLFVQIDAGKDYCIDVAHKTNKEFGTQLSRNAVIKRFQKWKKGYRVEVPLAVGYDKAFVKQAAVDILKQRAEELKEPKPILEPETAGVRDFEAENAQLRQVNQRIYKQLQTAKHRVDDLATAAIRGAYDAMIALGPLRPTATTGPGIATHNKSGEAALWHLTDWQGSKKTTSYDSEVMRERVQRFCRKAKSITDIQRADHPVDECIIAFGGDMVEGLFNFPTQPFEIDATLFGQFVNVSRLIVETVQCALSLYDRVEVVAEWGNHGRIGSKRAAVPRSDNVDRMTYELSRQLLQSERRLTWRDCPEDIQRIEIGNYRALLCHGDEVGRNGFASPMQIVRHANQWRSGSYPWEFRDLYVGHYHTHASWSMANGLGTVYQTGSTESDNRYARELMAAAAVPSQRLHFIDKERGRVTAEYKVYVDTD